MGIYQPREDSYLLKKYVRQFSIGRVLDMGTGSGIQALTAITNPNAQYILAVDKDEEAVTLLKEKVKKEKIRKIEVLQSDLFSTISGQFNLIIFNPPYLPQDKDIKDESIYGGKKGWELAARFFQDASKHLYPDGKVFFLFSSLTNKQKIEELLEQHLFQFQELERQKLPFEELYLYLIEKSPLLRELEKKGIEHIRYFAHGRRGNIFTGILDKSKFIKTHLSRPNVMTVAIKVKRPESQAQDRMRNEAKWLGILNKQGIGPEFLFEGEDYLVYRLVEGDYIIDWIQKNDPRAIQKVLSLLLQQCFTLDKLGVNKEELHRPLKHIIIGKDGFPVLLDFERCTETKIPHNVNQLVEFICRIKPELGKKRMKVEVESIRKLAGEYIKARDKKIFQELVSAIIS